MIKKSKSLYKEKKADISITLLVFMTIALCLIALFVFSSYDSSFSSKTAGAGEIQTFNFEEHGFEMYFQSLAEKIVSDIKNENKEITNEEFSKRFDAALKNASENYFRAFNYNITGGTYSVSQDNNILDIELIGVTFTKSVISSAAEINSISLKKDIALKIPLS